MESGIKEFRVSEGIFVSQYMLSMKSRVNEIHIKRTRVNQGVGVQVYVCMYDKTLTIYISFNQLSLVERSLNGR